MTARTLTEHGIRTAAFKIGIPEAAYRAALDRGLKWCSGHKAFCLRETFGPHWRRADRLSTRCREADREQSRAYQQTRRMGAVS